MSNIAIVGFGAKDLDSYLALAMFVLVGAAAAGVLFLLARHHHRCRKARKHRS
jgi:hypothetical protein